MVGIHSLDTNGALCVSKLKLVLPGYDDKVVLAEPIV